jgi:signal transduction histidine kinase
LPITAFFLVVIHQSLIHIWLSPTPLFQHFLWQVLVYGTIGPIVIWMALGWFTQWIHKREEAEAHLRRLYQVSRQAATATDMEALVKITLPMPEQIIQPVATSLILREHQEGPWTLAGTRGLKPEETEMLAARLTIGGSDLYCGRCEAFEATAQQDCPLRFRLPQANLQPTATSVICLPLSTERPPLALLNVYLSNEEDLSTSARQVLESMAAVLSVALDHARLRARELRMLHRVEQAARQRDGLKATLDHILKDVISAHHAQAGGVFLTSREHGAPTLVPTASWPEKKPLPHLVFPAQQALLDSDSITTSSQNGENLVAIPLMVEGLSVGVLVLSRPYPFTSAQVSFLKVAASMIALMIRNSQLYAELESQLVLQERNRLAREVHDGLAQSLGFLNFKIQEVDRSLAREQWKAARRILRELRAAIQDLYTEARLTIQDLRWFPEDGGGLLQGLREYVQAFGERTGLDVSLVVDGEPCLPPQNEVHLFRIVQEALTNVHKHAQAQHAWVRLRVGSEATILEVEDDGLGLSSPAYPQDMDSSDAPDHFGLRILKERAEAMGGQLSLHSVPGQGTRLQIKLNASYPVPLPLGKTHPSGPKSEGK